jgi:hypothetical protein
MGKTTYQTYTTETPIGTYRSDFIHRSAMCGAIAKRYPALGDVGKEADAILGQIDSHRADLQQAEDDQVRGRALEDAAKIDVLDVYTELRRTMAVKSYDVMTLLPDAPSALGRLGAKTFADRAKQAIANLKVLKDDDPLKTALLPKLEQELAEFNQADLAEDSSRTALQSERMALVLYKTELSQARERQLGTIQTVLSDRERTVLFTLPWRKASRTTDDEPATTTKDEPPPAP